MEVSIAEAVQALRRAGALAERNFFVIGMIRVVKVESFGLERQFQMAYISIDINADLGESEESLANGTDFELMRYITSANVACGGHAGNEQTMRADAVRRSQVEGRSRCASGLS